MIRAARDGREPAFSLRFTWEMVDAKDGNVRSVGHELLLLADDGRIRADYQFIESAA